MVATAIAGVLLAASVVEQRKAGKAQEKSQKLAQRKADISAARSRREQVRTARIRRADILSQSALTGGAGSASEAGAIGSLQGQLGQNLGESFLTQGLSQRQSQANIQAAEAGTKASIFGTGASFASSFIKPKAPKP